MDPREREVAEPMRRSAGSYTNRLSGQVVNISLVSGHFRGVAQHVPTQCYVAAGYQMMNPEIQYNIETDAGQVECYTTVFKKDEHTRHAIPARLLDVELRRQVDRAEPAARGPGRTAGACTRCTSSTSCRFPVRPSSRTRPWTSFASSFPRPTRCSSRIDATSARQPPVNAASSSASCRSSLGDQV